MFSHLRIIELASVLAGPSVGMFFAELGAEVIKVENSTTHGDVTRSWKLKKEGNTDITAYFSAVNWGKKSIALDLKSQEAKHFIYELAKKSDIVISSFLPGSAQRLGMDAETLMSHNPKLICGEINGYGETVERAAFDAIIQAEAGFTYMNGEGENRYKMPVALMDVLAAHQLKEALLLAYIEFLTTGKGKKVSVSLIEAGISSLVNQAANWLVAEQIPQAIGSEHPNIVPYGTIFRTADQKSLVLAVGTDAQFSALCQILGIENNSNFATNPQRVAEREAVNALLSQTISLQNRDDLLAKLLTAKVPAGAVNNLEEVFASPIAQQLQLSSPTLSGLRTFVAQGIATQKQLSMPPHLNEHAAEIRRLL